MIPRSIDVAAVPILLGRWASPVVAGWMVFASSLSGATGDWPAWRGPSATGAVEGDAGYPERWSMDSLAWKAALPGKGTSTPVVAGGRIYLTSPSAGQDAFLAYDLQGRKLWETLLGALSDPRHRSLASSCNASPVTDGKAVYAHFRSGHFAAVDLEGRVLWKHQLNERFGPEKLYWDSGASPLIAGDSIVISRLHDGESWVAAFDRRTGELRWKVARKSVAPAENNNGYATPILVDQSGRQAVLIWGADHVTTHALDDGRVLWTAGGFNPSGTANWPAIATPVRAGDTVLLPVGRDDRPGQANLYGLRLGGSGDVSASHKAWERHDVGVFVAAPVISGDRAYLLRHRGEVACLDPATGKTHWTAAFPKASAPYYASPVVAGGVLYAAREDGVVFAARVGREFRLLSENPMGERIIASPVPAAGRLILRGDQHLFCIAGTSR
jgi:outer membrane protein assembly factor BamB